MSLRKISDLEGINADSISSSEFKSAILEVSNPVQDENSVYSYKSMYMKIGDFMDVIKNDISSFEHLVDFENGLNLTGDLCCNSEVEYTNNYTGYFNFGNRIETHSPNLSIYIDDRPVVAIDSNKIYIDNDVNMNNHKIYNLKTPTSNYDAATKKYVDDVSSSIVNNLPVIGNVASCNYVVTESLPETLQANTFYFVVEKTS